MPYLRTVYTGDQVEVYEYEKYPEYYVPKKRAKRKKRAREDVDRRFYRRSDNIRRCKRDFIRIVRTNLNGNEKPAFLTLTMLEVVGIEQAYRSLSIFRRDLVRITKRNIQYIAVPEFQKRGAVHFHLLIWGLNDILENERYSRRIQNIWQRGYVDSILTDGSPKLAGYMAKYMSKAMSDVRLSTKKAYSRTRLIMSPLLQKAQEQFDDVSEYILGDVFHSVPLQDKTYDTYWLGKGRYRLFTKKNL